MIYHYIWLKDPDPGFQDPGPGRPNPGFQEGGPGRPETLPREDPENPGPGGRSIAAVSVWERGGACVRIFRNPPPYKAKAVNL